MQLRVPATALQVWLKPKEQGKQLRGEAGLNALNKSGMIKQKTGRGVYGMQGGNM